MINASMVTQDDIAALAQQGISAAFKALNPKYVENWYKLNSRYNSCVNRVLTTGYTIFDVYSSTFTDKKGRTCERLTLNIGLNAIPNNIQPNQYLELTFFGPTLDEAGNATSKPNAYFSSFVNLMAYKNPAAFSTVFNTNGFNGQEQTHYPNLFGATGVVSFIATNLNGEYYRYSAFFFDENPQQGQPPLSAYEYRLGKNKETPDFYTFSQILEERFEAWAGTPAESNVPQAHNTLVRTSIAPAAVTAANAAAAQSFQAPNMPQYPQGYQGQQGNFAAPYNPMPPQDNNPNDPIPF